MMHGVMAGPAKTNQIPQRIGAPLAPKNNMVNLKRILNYLIPDPHAHPVSPANFAARITPNPFQVPEKQGCILP